MGQGRGEEGKEEVKKATFPTLLTMIVAFFSPYLISKQARLKRFLELSCCIRFTH